jgi:hypothetical protein
VTCWLGVACSDSSDETKGSTSDPVFDVKTYDASCAAASDCVAVFSGNPCGCSCEMAAIATKARAKYDADWSAYQDVKCPGGVPECGACAETPAVSCTAGSCALVK